VLSWILRCIFRAEAASSAEETRTLCRDKHSRLGLTRRRLSLLLAAAAVARPAGAAPADLLGWGDTRWGMTRDELARVLGPARASLAPPLEYGELLVRDTLPGQRVANRPFVALFQLDRGSERLAQVLLRYRGDFPMLGDFAAVRDALGKDLGPPQERRAETDHRGSFPSFWIEAAWSFPTTAVVLSLTDPNAQPWSRKRKTLVIRYSPRAGQ
jgi:hypothetical protein